LDKAHALSLIKTPEIIPGDKPRQYKIEIMIDGIIYSSQMYDLGFIDQQLQVLVKILEAIKHE